MKKAKQIVLALVLVVSIALLAAGLAACNKSNYVHPTRVSVYETTGTQSSLLGRKSSLTFADFKEEDYSRQTVYVSTEETYQNFVGYGAAMTHASANLLMRADEDTRTEILNDLFSREGANFSVVRIPIGASDYVPVGNVNDKNYKPSDDFFTCDDMPAGETDEALEHFNLTHDADIIAVLKLVKAINPDVKFMASPWSAPAWMKDYTLVGGGNLNVSKFGEEIYGIYADYLVRFVSEYKKQGIDISMLSILNEPSVGALDYPTMNLTPTEAAKITSLAGQKLRAAGYDTDILGWDFNYGSSSAGFADIYLEELYENTDAGNYSSTVALHCYDGDGYYNSATLFGLKNGIQRAYDLGKSSLITEITENAGGTDFASNLTYASRNVVVNPCAVQSDEDDNFWNGCGGALYWNFVLTSSGGPTPSAHDACFGVISLDEIKRQGETYFKYTKSSAYYAMAQVSRFMYNVNGVPCKGIKATTMYYDLNVMAFLRGDGAAIVVVCNTSETNNAPIDVVINGKVISYDMLPQSMVTFVA